MTLQPIGDRAGVGRAQDILARKGGSQWWQFGHSGARFLRAKKLPLQPATNLTGDPLRGQFQIFGAP